MAFGWTVVHGGRTPPPGEVVAPDERLSWPRTVGLGAQHVVAMFGATFVFPLIMGLNPQLAIMMSGVATIFFLLIVSGRVPELPRHVARPSSAVVAAIRAQGGDARRRDRRDPGRRRGAGARAASLIHFARRADRPRGAAAGRDRRGRHADRLQPGAGVGEHLLAAGPVDRPAHDDRRHPDGRSVCAASSAGSRSSSVWSSGTSLSWLFDRIFGQITSVDAAPARSPTHWRLDLGGRSRRPTGSASRRRPTSPPASSAGTLPTSTWRSSCWCCRP